MQIVADPEKQAAQSRCILRWVSQNTYWRWGSEQRPPVIQACDFIFLRYGHNGGFLKHEGITDRERDRLKMSIKTPASWNDSSSRCYFETNLAQIRSEDWFVKIDLKDAYFHISILPYLPCGVKMKSCLYVLDLLTRGHLHLSKGWEGGWSRPSHLLMSRPVNLLLWLSGPTRPGVWWPLRPLYQELPSKRFVMRHVGPHHTHSSDFILWTWTLPQVP